MDRADLIRRARPQYSATIGLAGEVPKRLLGEIKTITELPANWDSNGAPPINQATRENALKCVRRLYSTASAFRVDLPTPRAFPSSDGALGLLWVSREGDSDLEILIRDEGIEAVASSRGETFGPVTPLGELDVLSLVLLHIVKR
jgi:hypothetical protein